MRGIREAVKDARQGMDDGPKVLEVVVIDALVLRGRCRVTGRFLYRGKGLDRLRMAGRARAYGRPYPYIPMLRNEALEMYPCASGVKELGGSPESADCFEFTFEVRMGHA